MTAHDLQNRLRYLLDQLRDSLDDDDADHCYGEEVQFMLELATFQERGILTDDAGLVLTAEDGSEYQITIVQSRAAH